MAKDIYLIMKQYALLSPKLSREEVDKSSSKQGRSESEKQHEGDLCRNKVDSLAQPVEELVQAL